jgi:hypothetical protein
MRVALDVNSIESYRQFLKIKRLPTYRIRGTWAEFPDEYASLVIGKHKQTAVDIAYDPLPGLFDYQRAIAALAIRKQKFAIFARVGLGKTLMFLEYVRHVERCLPPGQCILIVSPLMVIPQTIEQANSFYWGDVPLRQVAAADLADWVHAPDARIGITNYEAITDKVQRGQARGLVLDEASLLKSHYGKWGTRLIEIGAGLDWKLACTGTPAPNDRIEFANHAVFMDAFPTVNSFLARFFVNRGQTSERWEIKEHAVGAFYRAMSHWCIFLENPGTYGWKDNAGTLPPIHVHIDRVLMTPEQESIAYGSTGRLFHDQIGGITQRSKLAQLAKGKHKGQPVPTLKYDHIRRMVEQWSGESCIIWCKYNDEQDRLEQTFPGALSMRGSTPYAIRIEMLKQFKAGKNRLMITKPDILGFGQNLQIVTRMVFSSLQDSWEEYWQCIGRANRVGSKHALNVHIPVTDIERPMVDTVMEKAKRIEADTAEQERIFRGSMVA